MGILFTIRLLVIGKKDKNRRRGGGSRRHGADPDGRQGAGGAGAGGQDPVGEDKKRTQEWFLACGIQVPLGGNKFGFIRSIAQEIDSVNRKNSLSEKTSDTAYLTAVEYGVGTGVLDRPNTKRES